MTPLLVLVSVFLLALLVFKLRAKNYNWQRAGRIAMAAMLAFTALGHFMFTIGMSKMIPSIFPFKIALVYATGILEVLLGIGLLIPKTRRTTGWILILFFLAVLPANIKAAVEHINYQTGGSDGNGLEYLWFRIPLQLLFIAWVFFTAIKDFNTDDPE